MSADVLSGGFLWWIIGIAVGVPVILVVLTEVLNTLTRQSNPAAKPVRLLRNWVVPVGALFALLVFALRSPADQVWARVVATVLGFLVILLVLSAFNVALFSNAKAGSWRERIPSIFVELARLILVVVGLAILFQWVWEADVGGLIAALGVTSIVIGLALQNAVGGVVSGLLLLFEQPFKIGDYLEVGSVEGRVVEVNWRACHIDTGSGIQIVPNSTLSGASFTNRSQPLGPFHVTTTVTFTTDDPPHEVVQLLVDVADSLPMRWEAERAAAEYAGSGRYSVSLPIAGPSDGSRALSLYLAWLWYAARRRGLALDGDATDPIAEPGMLERALEVVGPTLHLGDEERDLVLSTGKLERYGRGEIVQAQGILPHEMRFIVDGRVRLAVEVAGGRVEFATAEPGDYVGQTALTREKTLTEAIAADVLTVLVLPLATVDRLVRARPLLAAEIGQSIELKRKLAAEALSGADVVREVLGGG
ncbi:Miniconductance mechanosensitive channel MscM [Microbacterium lemovicicum]|uniref:Miniconductance mechanosensitive channel MscM n=1 Tax=Microbacterium lemovicicum TaxID=1072463 RepID=A0A3S9W7D7_9MICO|nr:mechanosensitive ion channel domain-containing protein [Microbacterium lemovicicum]AZS36008.1 Miniconductance mechanosensitive channel MscM [Microbacterium lemovicicum]